MTTVNSVETLIAKHEGREANIYRDQKGIPTIGIGHNLNAHPLPDGVTPPLTDEQIDAIFASDLRQVQVGLSESLQWFGQLDEVRQAVLIDMGFEMGVADLLTFKHTLGCVEAGNWQAAVDGMKASLWAREVPTRAEEDMQMMLSGNWPAD